MTKLKQMQKIERSGVVAIIRASDASLLIEVVDAIQAGGIDIIEITMTTPNALGILEEAVAKFGDEVLLGVGSVLDAETTRISILSGAEFVVSPVTRPDVIETCNRYGKVVMPGAFTPTEILTAWEIGADYVKVFPSSVAGARYIKEIKAPLPQIELIPTGGITIDNAGEFIAAGSSALGVGSGLVNQKIIAEREFETLTENASRLIQTVQEARNS
ncbi:TPA: bifunctional 4-hydroxy-2-oxoglutarate aldolase/2-dehydro-3-deoxy-phosphogluconate aldolase [Candidatus Poribacteria bacterium]|nr:bifunctional 4-hydroxy-2-oxoglutarate aldolase/2-dehydro-3-deoxy-phosphogluconate aldolase [Candidatus Poribacteria bacterium]